jgi:hypothetical protein
VPTPTPEPTATPIPTTGSFTGIASIDYGLPCTTYNSKFFGALDLTNNRIFMEICNDMVAISTTDGTVTKIMDMPSSPHLDGFTYHSGSGRFYGLRDDSPARTFGYIEQP